MLGMVQQPRFACQGVKIYSWANFLKLGEGKPVDPVPPKASDPATYMYTSGTTGERP